MMVRQANFNKFLEAPPDQRAYIPKHDSKLINFCHLSSLPDIPRKLHGLPPDSFSLHLDS
jgi:hypothetical protein